MEQPTEAAHSPAGPRAPRLSADPIISAIVLSDRGPVSLEACLDSLIAQSGELDVEIVVVRATSDVEQRHALKAAHPSVRFVFVPAGAGNAQLRAAGMAAAAGDIITFIDQQQLSSIRWLTRLPWSRERQRPGPLQVKSTDARANSHPTSSAERESPTPPYASFSSGRGPDERETVE